MTNIDAVQAIDYAAQFELEYERPFGSNRDFSGLLAIFACVDLDQMDGLIEWVEHDLDRLRTSAGVRDEFIDYYSGLLAYMRLCKGRVQTILNGGPFSATGIGLADDAIRKKYGLSKIKESIINGTRYACLALTTSVALTLMIALDECPPDSDQADGASEIQLIDTDE